MNALDSTSTRPYLVRALYEWCTDNGLTPYVAVAVDETVQVPREYVKNNEIVLNISFDATTSLSLGNEFIEFKARFAGSARDIMVPIGRVIAIYARENGQGMAFPLSSQGSGSLTSVASSEVSPEDLASGATVSGAAAVTITKDAVTGLQGSGSESKIFQLVPTGSSIPASEDEAGPPEPPKPKQGIRPSLKRVK